MSDKAIDLFVKQVRQACEKSGDPLPETVKNYRPGDTVLYLKGKPGPTAPLTDRDFDLVNNNTDELEIF